MNRYIIITGATSGFGKATAVLFASHGYSLVIVGRRMELLQELKESLLDKYSIDIIILNIDVQKRDEVKEALDSIKNIQDKIDGFAQNRSTASYRNCPRFFTNYGREGEGEISR